MIYIDINQSPNLIFEHNIEKKWGSVHQDLGQNERLPLPHTKGTKPAPSTLKVLVYLIQVKKKNGCLFWIYYRYYVPVEGLEPPLF